MKSPLTPFRLLPKDIQKSFKQTYGTRFTGIDFNKFYKLYRCYIEQGGENQAQSFIDRDWTQRGMAYCVLSRRIVTRIVPGWKWSFDVEYMQKAFDEANKVIDMFTMVDKAKVKENMHMKIEAESDGLITLEDLKKELWMFSITQFSKSKLNIRLGAKIDFNAKTHGFHYQRWYTVDISKTGYYDLGAIKAGLKKNLIDIQKAEYEARIAEINKINEML